VFYGPIHGNRKKNLLASFIFILFTKNKIKTQKNNFNVIKKITKKSFLCPRQKIAKKNRAYKKI